MSSDNVLISGDGNYQAECATLVEATELMGEAWHRHIETTASFDFVRDGWEGLLIRAGSEPRTYAELDRREQDELAERYLSALHLELPEDVLRNVDAAGLERTARERAERPAGWVLAEVFGEEDGWDGYLEELAANPPSNELILVPVPEVAIELVGLTPLERLPGGYTNFWRRVETVFGYEAVEIGYDSKSSGWNHRVINPLAVNKEGLLEAYCHRRGEVRHFNPMRIESFAEVDQSLFEPPAGSMA